MSEALSRRNFLALTATAAAASATGCGHRPLVAPAPTATPAVATDAVSGPNSLRVSASAAGYLFGCAVNVPALTREADYAELVRSQASIVVAENAMKWQALRPAIDRFDFDQADQLLAFAETNRQKVRGHNLAWHRQLPAWFATEATPANARALLTEHIDRVVGRYAGRMHSWDVVNEAVQLADGRADGLRDSPWMKLLGPDYIEIAFRQARVADPQALLAYNDYGLEAEDNASQAKRTAVLLLLRRLRTRGVPIDAIGVQSHLSAGGTARYGSGLRRFLAECRELNLQIFLTELDVNDRALPAAAPVRDEAVARAYADYLNLLLPEPDLRVVVTWGLTDRHTWLNGEGSRPDGQPERCLPFDAALQPTPAFFATRNCFDRRRARNAG